MASNNDKEALVAIVGLAVVGGIFLLSSRAKEKCTELPDIWAPSGPLHMTREAQDSAYEAARYKLREYILAGTGYTLSDVKLYVADSIRDCEWEKLDTDRQKDVWNGISSIVNEVNQRAKDDPDEFLKSFSEV